MRSQSRRTSFGSTAESTLVPIVDVASADSCCWRSLDELYSVDFMGVRIRLNRFAGSALKFWSPSLTATAIAYVFLLGLTAAVILGDPPEWR